MVILLSVHIAALAQQDVWHELFRTMRFADINRARLQFDCRETPLFSSEPSLKRVCEKQHLIPDQIMEDAALPFLQKHFTEKIARQAIEQLSSATRREIGAKVILGILSGKGEPLTQVELEEVRKLNQSEAGKALLAFTSDRSQGFAVAQAILKYVH